MNSHIKIAVLGAVLFLAAGAGNVSADFDEKRWEYFAPVSGSRTGDADFVTFDITSDLFARLKPDLSDLRVVNREGEVPYVVAVEHEAESTAFIPSRMFNLSSVPGSATSFTVDLGGPGIFHNSLIIRTPSENFRRMLEVEGSDDASSWRMLNAGGQIFDYTVRDIAPVSVESLGVYYPESTFRYLRVSISDRGESPLKISGVDVRREIKTDAHEVSYEPVAEISENSAEKATEVILDMGSRGIPHNFVSLNISDSNFSRAVALAESDDKEEWRSLGHAYIFSIDTAKFKGKRTEFYYPESGKRYLRLRILNRDDKSLRVGNVVVKGIVRSILFKYDPSGEYYIYAGNPAARRPQYDIEAISQYIDMAHLGRVSAGNVEKNPSFEAILLPLSERSPYILPVILVAVVALLGLILFRLFSKSRQNSAQ